MDLGLQQKQLAERLGVGAMNVANWEKGLRHPESRYLPGLIDVLGSDPRIVPADIGGRLAHRRTALGFSQEALAKRLGLDRGTVKRWEQGTREPRGRCLLKVLQFLGDEPSEPLSIADRLRRYREKLGAPAGDGYEARSA